MTSKIFTAVSSAFPVLFFDQFGVLHNGRSPYPGAIEALAQLKAQGKRVVILSNSGKLGQANAKRMEKLGFPPSLYDYFLTSGDVARSALLNRDLPIALRPGMQCLTISSSEENDLADALGLAATQDGAQADLLIISGSQGDRIPLSEYQRRIAPAARRSAPCLHESGQVDLDTRGNVSGRWRDRLAL